MLFCDAWARKAQVKSSPATTLFGQSALADDDDGDIDDVIIIIIAVVIIIIIIILMAWMLDDSGASVPPGRASSPLNTTTIKSSALNFLEAALQQIALHYTTSQYIIQIHPTSHSTRFQAPLTE